MAIWRFPIKQAGEKERNPVTAEYFDEESSDRPAQALVREVIQNSLDAMANGDAVRVRFFYLGILPHNYINWRFHDARGNSHLHPR